MSVGRVLYLVIAYVILFFFWMIFRWIILPHLRVGVYALQPSFFWVSLWKVLMSIAGTLFNYICMALVMIWIVYLLIKTFIPNFPIPLRTILLKIPPFPQLEKGGIFDLFSGIAGIVFSRSSFKERMVRAGKRVGMFISKNVDLTLSVLGLKGAVDRIQFAPRDGASTPPPVPKRGGHKKPSSKFEKSEDRLADDVYQQCMEENTIVIEDGMSEKEKQSATRKNLTTSTFCKTKSLQSYASTLMYG